MSSRTITVAAVQMASGSWTIEDNLATAERLVRDAARQGANGVVCPEWRGFPTRSDTRTQTGMRRRTSMRSCAAIRPSIRARRCARRCSRRWPSRPRSRACKAACG